MALARTAGRVGDENRIMANLAWLRWSSGKAAEGLELAREAEARSLAAEEPARALRASIIVGAALQNNGDLSGAHAPIRRVWVARASGIKYPTWLPTASYYLAMLENFAGPVLTGCGLCSQGL